jgi:hypothetical protein
MKAGIKKAPQSAGLLCSAWRLTSFSSSRPFSLLELSSLWAFVSPPILVLFTTIAHLFRVSFVLKIFLSHVTRKFKAKITLSPEIYPLIKRSVLMGNVGKACPRRDSLSSGTCQQRSRHANI